MAEDQTTNSAEDKCDYLFTRGNRRWYEKIACLTYEMYRLVVECSPHVNVDAYSYCVEMLWKTSSEAYPSTNQLDAVMRRQQMDPEMRSNICRLYKKCFPWVSSSSPVTRSLLHLSRCAIKRQLRENDDVDQLPLPDKLKWYLHFVEEIEFFWRSGGPFSYE